MQKLDIDQLVHWIKNRQQILLMLDYDGTLIPFAKDIENAFLSSETKQKLMLLQQFTNVELAIVSGRRIEDLHRFFGMDNIIYCADHGLRMQWKNSYCRFLGDAFDCRKIVAGISQKISQHAKRFPKSIHIEHKPYSTVLHYQQATDAEATEAIACFEKYAASIPDEKNFQLLRGNRLMEIRSSKQNKGVAIGFLLNEFSEKDCAPIYIGDDTTDEDAFEALGDRGVSIKVGETLNSQANFFVEEQKEVESLLDRLLAEFSKTVG